MQWVHALANSWSTSVVYSRSLRSCCENDFKKHVCQPRFIFSRSNINYIFCVRLIARQKRSLSEWDIVCAAAAGKYIGARTHSFWVIEESFPWPAPINPLQYGLFPYHAHQNILTHRERDLRKRNEKVSAALSQTDHESHPIEREGLFAQSD